MKALRETNKLLGLALLVGLAFHGSAIFFTLESTYDALIHLFFADHYANDWFGAWEPRWYTGFTVHGYPPLVHQLIGLLSLLGGLKFGLYAVALIAVVLFITGMYRFALLLTGHETVAGTAALLAVFSSAFIETLHLFGQLPSIFGLSLLLHALPEIYKWLRDGRKIYLIRSLSLIAVTVCSHHVTPIFGMVFFIFPLIGMAVMDRSALRLGSLKAVTFVEFYKSFRQLFWRIVSFGAGTLVVVVFFILPYWINTKQNPIAQVPIPHGSRDNFLEVTSSGLVFFLIPWGVILLFLPYIFYRFFSKRYLFFGLSLALLTLLGTGGTTPLPRMMLGEAAFNILTLDRFTLWASMMSLPIFAELCYRYLAGDLRAFWISRYGSYYHRLVGGAGIGAMLFMVVFSMSLGYFRPSQPAPIKMLPIANFLQQDQHDHWRYLTLGFGDQMAWLSAQTRALTVDGNYHSARRLPELTSRAVERLENSKFRGFEGLGSLQQFLTVPEKYHLKFIFSNDKFYDPLLYFCGWQRLQLLENGIMVWERAGVPPLPAVLPQPYTASWLNLLWGINAMASLLLLFLVTAQWELFRPLLRKRGAVAVFHAYPHTEYKGFRPGLALWSQIWGWSMTALILVSLAGSYWNTREQSGPRQVLMAYYDALDFKEFERAHSYLDAGSGVSLDQYLLEISVSDGLLSSYAKLDSLAIELGERLGNVQRAVVHGKWITPLEVVERSVSHTLREREGKWFLEAEAPDPDLPPAQLVTRPEVTLYNHGRRRITTQQTYHEDVLRQPRLELLSSRLIRDGAQYALVGWIRNADAVPADLSLSGCLRDSEGGELACYNVQQAVKHKLWPGEATPFRIRFEETAWSEAGQRKPDTFDPSQFNPVQLGRAPASFELMPSGNLTTSDLYDQMTLNLESLDSERLKATLHNVGTQEVTVPQLLISYYDRDRSPMWVEAHYPVASVRVQRRLEVSYELPDLSGLQAMPDIAPMQSAAAAAAWADLQDGLIPVAGKGYSYINIKLNQYVGNPR